MQVETPAQMKFFHELEIGELAYSTIGRGEGYVVPVRKNGSRCLVAAFSGSLSGFPIVHEVENFRAVTLSYGLDWVFDPILDTPLRSAGNRETPGAVHYNRGMISMWLAPFNADGFTDGMALGLSPFGDGKISNDGFCTLRWRIWASREHKDRVGSVPLLNYTSRLAQREEPAAPAR